MDTFRNILGALVLSLFATQASAYTISSVGDSFLVDWSTTTTNGSLISANSTFTVDSFSTTAIALTIDITNTTILTSLLTNADITTFGFGVDPNATATLVSAGSTFDMVSAGSGPHQNFPGGYKDIDICIYADGCSGGNTTHGLRAGETDTVKILLSGDFSSGFAELLYFPLKFQTSNGSYEPAGCVNGDCTSIPEPTVPALLGIGLLLMTILRRRTSRPLQVLD